MWDLISDKAEIFGAFSLVILLLIVWLKLTLDRVKDLEKDNKDMSEKAIKIMTLATKSMEKSEGMDQQVKDALANLTTELRLNTCKYSP